MTLRALQSIASKNNRDERRATSRSGTMLRYEEGAQSQRRLRVRRTGQILPLAKFAPPLTEDVAIQGLSASITEFPLGDISRAAQGTKEAAKGWRLGKTMPRAVHLINMARNIPEVRNWLMEQIVGEDDHPESERALNRLADAMLRRIELRGRID